MTDLGHSPYATGGGGVTFERRVAVHYLARLLSGSTGAELNGRRVSSVSFQQAPAHPVDDLVVRASREDGSDPLVLALAIRRAPTFTKGNAKMLALWGDLLEGVRTARTAAEEYRLGICVAGSSRAVREVAELCDLARQQSTAAGFLALVRKPRAFRKALRDRLDDHLVGLAESCLSVESAEGSRLAEAEVLTWELLCRLEVVMSRLEPPDEADWAGLLAQLEPWTGEHTIAAAIALRDRLASLAASYAPAAADVDVAMLRRDVNDLLDRQRRLRVLGWGELRRLDSAAQAAVRLGLGSGTDGESFRLPRSDEAQKLRDGLSTTGAVLVTGQSGIGKSALVLGELAALSASNPVEYDIVFLNLRQLPPTMMEMRQALGAPLEELLAEMSAPTRLLVIDATDVVAERDDQVLSQLLRAAGQAGATPWLVASDDGRAAVRAVMDQVGETRELSIGGLSDTELGAIAQEFAQLRRIVGDPFAKELLRRPAIVDLILRSGTTELPLSDAEAFGIVWDGLIRGSGSARGLPDARDQVMSQLAARELSQAAPDGSLDQDAVAGLKHDGILRSADRWQRLPTFAHDVVRTYALARYLLEFADPMDRLIEAGAPRWTLPAARLVVQVQLTEGDSAQSPAIGRLGRAQASVDRLSAAGHGDRWGDLPSEAVLTLPNAKDILADAWPLLMESNCSGLRRLLRVLDQRFGRTGIVEPLVADPVVGLLFEHGWPSHLEREVDELVNGWLRGCISTVTQQGHPHRIKLRQRFVDRVAQSDTQLAEASSKRVARLAARSPEQVAADQARFQKHRHLLKSPLGVTPPPGPRRELPAPLQDPDTLGQLALLSVDLGEEGAALLQRVAADAPDKLGPALEGAWAGLALATFDINLLARLVEAYYIDVVEGDYEGMARRGIRGHVYLGWDAPLFAAWRGPFLAMLRANFRVAVACINRLLNHATTAHVQIHRRLGRSANPATDDDFRVEIDFGGECRRYLGDAHVWNWYRGTGSGPYPCMSALQALELVCDQTLEAGVPLNALVRALLDGCESVAIPALIVGLLTRHLERVRTELDPFLADPRIWRFEFERAIKEHSFLEAQTDGVVAPERRLWNLRDVAMQLTVAADGARLGALKEVGCRLVDRERAAVEEAGLEGEEATERLAIAEAWASALDRDTFRVRQTGSEVVVEQTPSQQIIDRLARPRSDSGRALAGFGFMVPYQERYEGGPGRPGCNRDRLVADLATARNLLDDPPDGGLGRPFDAPALVAAAALEAHFGRGMNLPQDDLVWAASVLVVLPSVLAETGASEPPDSIHPFGLDCSAGRGLPLLWLPRAGDLKNALEAEEVGDQAIAAAVRWVVEHGTNLARLFLARALDPVWETPCDVSGGSCHHQRVFTLVEDLGRDCLILRSRQPRSDRRRIRLEGVVASQLNARPEAAVDVERLSPALRAAGAAAASSACCREAAKEFVLVSRPANI